MLSLPSKYQTGLQNQTGMTYEVCHCLPTTTKAQRVGGFHHRKRLPINDKLQIGAVNLETAEP